MNVEIRFEPDSLRQSRSGSITGVVALTSNAACFPEEGWSDFVVVIAGWWLRAIRSLGTGELASQDLDFMDGPFRARVSREGKDHATIEFVHDDLGHEIVEGSHPLDLGKFAERVHEFAKQVLRVCDERSFRATPDLEILRGLVGADR